MKQLTLSKNLLQGAASLLFLVVFLFPPADYHSNLFGYYQIESEGFVFLSEVGGNTKIRYTQWIVQLVICGLLVFFTFKNKPQLTLSLKFFERFRSNNVLKKIFYLFLFCAALIIGATILEEYDNSSEIKSAFDSLNKQPPPPPPVSKPAPPPDVIVTHSNPLPPPDSSPSPQSEKLVQKTLPPRSTPVSTPVPSKPSPLRYVLDGDHQQVSIPMNSRVFIYNSPTPPRKASGVIQAGIHTILISDLIHRDNNKQEWVMIEANGTQGWVLRNSIR